MGRLALVTGGHHGNRRSDLQSLEDSFYALAFFCLYPVVEVKPLP